LPQAVEDVVLKALAKDPQQRYVSVQLFAQAFERASQESERAHRYAAVKTVSLDPLSSPSRMTSRRVFLCAAQEDEVFVARLTADLELRDIVVENEELASDVSMSNQGEAVRRAMRASQAVVLLASPHAYSSRAVKDHLRVAAMYKRPVVALWVAGEDRRQTFPQLEETTPMIDARNGGYQQALEEMVTWLERERSVSSPVAPFPPEPGFEPRNPYKGLRAFRPEDAEDFFGRETLIQDLLKQVKEVTTPPQSHFPTERLLTVIGPSGSGKSSVVMAGLLPRLQKGHFLEARRGCI
jgi:hypothetical protein